jgi:hypothetical protein
MHLFHSGGNTSQHKRYTPNSSTLNLAPAESAKPAAGPGYQRHPDLVTRDKALLKLARRAAQSGRFKVLAPDAFLRRAHGLLPG